MSNKLSTDRKSKPPPQIALGALDSSANLHDGLPAARVTAWTSKALAGARQLRTTEKVAKRLRAALPDSAKTLLPKD